MFDSPLFWKISPHPRTFPGALTFLVLAFGPSFALLYLLVLPIAWARVDLGGHSLAQAGTGALLGVVIAAAVFSARR
jgi:membrane-associated phospholipid phosphatase